MAADQRTSGAAPTATRSDQRGETLLEVLLSIALVTIVFLAAIGAMYTAATVSNAQRKNARTDTLLRSAAEKLQSPDNAYVARAGCSGANNYALAPSISETGYTLSIASVTFWAGASSSPVSSASTAFTTTCPTTSANDPGLQLVTLKVVDPNRVVSTLPVIKRRP